MERCAMSVVSDLRHSNAQADRSNQAVPRIPQSRSYRTHLDHWQSAQPSRNPSMIPATKVARLCTFAPTKSMNHPHSPTTRFPPALADGPARFVMNESYEEVRAPQLMEMKEREEKYCRSQKALIQSTSRESGRGGPA